MLSHCRSLIGGDLMLLRNNFAFLPGVNQTLGLGNPRLTLIDLVGWNSLFVYAHLPVGGVVIKLGLKHRNRRLGVLHVLLKLGLERLHVDPIIVGFDDRNLTSGRERHIFDGLIGLSLHDIGIIAILDHDGFNERLISRALGHDARRVVGVKLRIPINTGGKLPALLGLHGSEVHY